MFPLPDPSSLLAGLVRRTGRSLGKAGVHVTFFPSVFSNFPGLSRVLIHRRVRKPTDGTVLFLEEPSLFGGQRWDARMLGKLCTSGKFLPMQKHKQSLTMEKAPWPFICPWPKALCKAGMFVHSHGTLSVNRKKEAEPPSKPGQCYKSSYSHQGTLFSPQPLWQAQADRTPRGCASAQLRKLVVGN